MDNVTVSLVIGHSKNKPGACNETYGICEYDFNEYIVNSISRKLHVIPHKVHYRQSYSDLPAQINLFNPRFVVSFHCNAFNKTASGTEVLYYSTSEKGKEIARIFNDNLVKALGLNDRGIKPKSEKDRGGYLLRHTLAPCIICEPFFIDNNSDLERAQDNKEDLVVAYTNSILEVINKEIY
jgi:N-acetylmuramoyl-L-alanine amidase